MDGQNAPTSYISADDGVTLSLVLPATAPQYASRPKRVPLACRMEVMYEIYGFILRNEMDPMWPPEIPLPTDSLQDIVQDVYVQFIARIWDPQKFPDLVVVAYLMGSSECMDLLCARMAIFLKFELRGEGAKEYRDAWLDNIKKELKGVKEVNKRIEQYSGLEGWNGLSSVPVVPRLLPGFLSPYDHYVRMKGLYDRWRLIVRLNPILVDPRCGDDDLVLRRQIATADAYMEDPNKPDPIFPYMTQDQVALERTAQIRLFLDTYGPFPDIRTFLDKIVEDIDLKEEDPLGNNTSAEVGLAEGDFTKTYRDTSGGNLYESDPGSLVKFSARLGYALTMRFRTVAPILFPEVKGKDSETREVVKRLIRVAYPQCMMRRLRSYRPQRHIGFYAKRMQQIEDEYVLWVQGKM